LEDRARSTKDIDLAWRADENELLDVLINAATHDTGDFFTFTIERTNDPPQRFGGAHRFRVVASLAGRPFETFVLDVGRTDDVVGTEILMTPNLLDFAGIAPVAVPAVPIVAQEVEAQLALAIIELGIELTLLPPAPIRKSALRQCSHASPPSSLRG
jgi:Nucleotidyl transferase AbiEii toxin, Type IV TA system